MLLFLLLKRLVNLLKLKNALTKLTKFFKIKSRVIIKPSNSKLKVKVIPRA